GDQTEITVDQISIEDLRRHPYKATVTYTKTYYTQLDHVLRGRDKFTAHVQFIVMDKVPHNLIALNPLGLTITYLREDQAFTDSAQRPSPAPASSSPVPPQSDPYATYPTQQPAPQSYPHHNAPTR